MSPKNQQLLLVGGIVILSVILYFAPAKKETLVAEAQPAYSFEGQLEKAKRQLKREESETLANLEKKMNEGGAEQNILLDSLAKRWDALENKSIAAHYFETLAQKTNDEKTWLNAAYRYFDAFQSENDSVIRAVVVQKAIDSYNNVLKINPANLDAKTDLGVCYTDGTAEPMKGIMLLREVVSTNPQHENAQYNLGILSMRSGQYAKATERFEKVLSINPERKEIYLMISKSYLLSGNKDKAKENLERLKKETNNPELLGQANNLLNSITNH
jgi:tetratricopeptide (TPR) repeat protein